MNQPLGVTQVVARSMSMSAAAASGQFACVCTRPRAHRRRRHVRRSAPVRAGVKPADPTSPLVKVCGVTTAEDATHAARAGANFIGMILWPKSKRSIALDVAKEVAAAAKEAGAVPVGVFVDESAEEIVAGTLRGACEAVGIDHAQLHGDGARAALKDIPMRIKVVYVVNATAEGKIVTRMPRDDEALAKEREGKLQGKDGWKAAIDWVSGPRATIDWLLVDGEVAGSGETYDWTNLKVPKGCSRKGWILAGGLDPENVSQAIATARPNAVDVASGVTKEGGVLKDPSKVDAFIANAAAGVAA